MVSHTLSNGVFYARLLLWTFVASAVFIPDFYQPALSALWMTLYNSSFYNLSTFETVLTVTSYAIFEPLYTRKFARNSHLRIDVRDAARHHAHGANDRGRKASSPKLPKMKRPTKRLGEILLYIAPLLLMDLTMIKKFAGVPLDEIRTSGGYAPLSTVLGRNVGLAHYGINNTLQANNTGSIHATFLLPTLHNFTLSSPFQLTRALPSLPPTSRRLTLELFTSLFIYDALFFALHLSLHTIPVLSRTHLTHHTHAEMHPQITNRLSVPERLSLVLLANFSLNVIGSHILTRTVFVPIFVDLLIEVHCGMDLPYGYEKFLPEGWGLGGREHARHHRTGGGCYAPFFAWWDGVLASLRRGRVKMA